ncbi:OLC1v1037542C1 [Oldenlandia corymbosa var. corymbosa]|uniref:OLC1v1037542C1 n=1 Tax=Oldenlandia corymbosa var. corymbosa TaxID=529605 RepID=A0AAV1CY98_OLDCO|nr:OLC1v1037542C1 [Oldenlandia corymbosa var. corymbosa]
MSLCSNKERKPRISNFPRKKQSSFKMIETKMNSEVGNFAQNLPLLDSSPALNFIDLSSSDVQNTVALVRQACIDSGFFYVINHGISQELMDEVFDQSKKFFNLPLKEKMKVLRNGKHRGYTPLLDEVLDPVNQVHGDYKEGYYIGVDIPEDDPEAEKPFNGPNLWPTADILPGWRETMERYHQEALEVARTLARIIALALNLDSNFFDPPEMLGKPLATLRLLRYEGPHCDYGLVSLLASDDAGLQICKDKHATPQIWEYVTPVKGAFVVNLGDMLERWSNCAFRSTLHRVISLGQERYSVAFFVEPNYDCIVECLPTCHSNDNPPKYPPIMCGDYMVMKYKDTHADLRSYSATDTSA